MITIRNFISAYEHYHCIERYQQQSISLRVLQEQAFVMLDVCDKPYPSVTNPVDITQSDIAWLLEQEEATQSYTELLGGNVYICETEVDLLEINGCDFDWAETHDGRWPNVTDLQLSWDVCEYLNEPTGNPHWVIFLLCWNNAGGNIYYVPKHLWVQARVTEHIAATK